ncbi:hypothetical protein [Synechococcus sp. LTW-G]
MSRIPDLAVEVGYNHMGSVYLLESMVRDSCLLADRLTFQYRDISNLTDQRLQLSFQVLVEMKSYARSLNPALRIGLAIDSEDGFLKASEHFDFCKILSVQATAPWLSSLVSPDNTFPVYVSLGLASMFALDESHPLLTNTLSTHPIYTSFSLDGSDISSAELTEISNKSSSISFGSHQEGTDFIKLVCDSHDCDIVFAYLSAFTDKCYNPDSLHSLTINELKDLKSYFVRRHQFLSQPPRNNYQQYKPAS